MDSKRSKGRPNRGEGQVGREALLSAAREVLRSSPGQSVTRQDVARAAKVTPALINYYFDSSFHLVEAAIRPVIEENIVALMAILLCKDRADQRLRAVIRLFVAFNKTDAVLLDNYLMLAGVAVTGRHFAREILDAYAALCRFFLEGVQQEQWSIPNTNFVVFALWGMCKVVAQNPALPIPMFPEGLSAEDTSEREAELIFDLVTRGIGVRKDGRHGAACDPPP